MKVKLLVLVLAVMVFGASVFAQVDPGQPDSLILQFAHVPDLTINDSVLTLEIIVLNDEALAGLSPGFKWNTSQLQLVSAAFTTEGSLAFDLSRLVYYRNRLDSSNNARKFQCTGLRLMSELAVGRTHIATYNFKLLAEVDSIIIDTSSFNKMAFVASAGSVEFTPRWNGPLVYDYPQDVKNIDNGNLPTSYSLAQNYPNPFNPETTFEFGLPKASAVELTIYNVLGQRVITLINQELAAGTYRETWRGTSESGGEVASGIYFYRLTAGDFVTTKKMMLLK